MKNRDNTFLNLDWITVFIYLTMVILGWINIYAAVFDEEHQSIFDMTQRYGKQMVWIIAGVVLAVSVMLIDSKFYAAFAYHFYGFTILLFVSGLFFWKEFNCARAWFEIGNIALQPAELGKFATNLAIAKYISQYSFKMENTKSHIILGGLIAIPAILIIMQNDTGSALVYSVFILVMYREGLTGLVIFWGFAAIILFVLALVWDPFRILLFLVSVSIIAFGVLRVSLKVVVWGVLLVGTLFGSLWGINLMLDMGKTNFQMLLVATIITALVFVIYGIKNQIRQVWIIVLFFIFSIGITMSVNYAYQNILESHQRDRIDELLGISSDPLGAGYNVNQSKIAIGSGGLLGKGFLKGTQTKYNFVPEQSTDFIFCTVGEEWGFAGTSVVVLLFLALLLRLIVLAERQKSRFSRVYGYGVAGILFFHFAINISMTIGLAPVIGIPLPFFSYGGSSLWAFTILLFIFLRLDASRSDILR